MVFVLKYSDLSCTLIRCGCDIILVSEIIANSIYWQETPRFELLKSNPELIEYHKVCPKGIVSINHHLDDIWGFRKGYLQNPLQFTTTIYCISSNLTQSHICDISSLTSQCSSTLFKLHNH